MKKYFGTDGIRGTVGESNIKPDFVLKLGWAAGRILGHHDRPILIGKDTRISGYMFESALQAGLVASGRGIMLLGPLPTPGIAYLTRTLRAAAGIVITASHNPFNDNGIKFFSPAGDKMPDEVELAIEQQLDQPMTSITSESLGKAERLTDAAGRYIEFCKSTIAFTTNLSGYRIVVDCAHGATYHVAPQVFRELGAKVHTIGVAPDGFNINAGVGSTHLGPLKEAVVKHHADLGIAFDGDGDRVLFVDSKGNDIDGDLLLYIIACQRLARGSLRGNVVGTVMTNLGLEQALARKGIGFERTQVGDRYIIARLKETDSTLGGEQSGHIICRDLTTTGDGIISALQVLAATQELNKPIDELCHEVTRYPQTLINVRVNNPESLLNSKQLQACARKVEDKLGQQGRLVLRASGTEPLIRIMIEANDSTVAQQLAEEIAEELNRLANSSDLTLS